MADIRVTRSKTKCCFTPLTLLGTMWLESNMKSIAPIRDVAHMEDIIQDMKNDDIVVTDE